MLGQNIADLIFHYLLLRTTFLWKFRALLWLSNSFRDIYRRKSPAEGRLGYCLVGQNQSYSCEQGTGAPYRKLLCFAWFDVVGWLVCCVGDGESGCHGKTQFVNPAGLVRAVDEIKTVARAHLFIRMSTSKRAWRKRKTQKTNNRLMVIKPLYQMIMLWIYCSVMTRTAMRYTQNGLW